MKYRSNNAIVALVVLKNRVHTQKVAVLLHTMVQKEGLPSTAEVTKTGGLNLKFDIIDRTLIIVAQEVPVIGRPL